MTPEGRVAPRTPENGTPGTFEVESGDLGAGMLETRASAKLNLYLDVLGKRPDGFHELETLFLELPWGDDVLLETRPPSEPEVILEVEGDPRVPAGRLNLAHRAATAFLERRRASAGTAPGVRIRIRKRIPPGAGLGGGSSDAAAVLRLLERAVGPLPPGELGRVARDLGADVPFFLAGGAAVGRGRGDEIESLPPPPSLEVVLLLPDLSNETATVFAHASPAPGAARGLARAVEALTRGDPRGLRDAHRNALARAAEEAYPAFRTLVRDVESRVGRRLLVSGSGAALYDLPLPGETEDVLRRLADLPVRLLALRT